MEIYLPKVHYSVILFSFTNLWKFNEQCLWAEMPLIYVDMKLPSYGANFLGQIQDCAIHRYMQIVVSSVSTLVF